MMRRSPSREALAGSQTSRKRLAREVTAVTIAGNDRLFTRRRWLASLRDKSPS